MSITPEQELWGVALWLEKQHGPNGPRFIAGQAGRLALANDAGGLATWRKVAARFALLYSRTSDS